MRKVLQGKHLAALAEKKILGQVNHYQSKAQFYKEVGQLIKSVFEETKSDLLVDLNINSIKTTCSYLEIDFTDQQPPKQSLQLGELEHAGQWALKLSQEMKATDYINPEGGIELFKAEEWEESGVKLHFQTTNQINYGCSNYEFAPALSILDAMMWNESAWIKSKF